MPQTTTNKLFTKLPYVAIVALLCGALCYLFPSYDSGDATALSYQNSTDVSFTFDPILSISVSPDFITIPTIAPGTTDTSNTITVNVSTNTAYGYSLLASVGNNTQYNTSDLIHSDSTIDSTFTSISPTASLSSLTDDNTWGYSTSLDNGSTWSTYHGLPLYSTVDNNTATNSPALLIDTKSPADSKSIDFRIAARASSTQPSGTYSNVINFYAVGKPEPMDLATAFAKSGAQKTEQGYYRMQDMTANICNNVEVIHSAIRLQDVRDNKIYTVAKLKDNNCWMAENLNLAGGTEITNELSDIPEGYVLPTANGFQSGNRLPESTQSGFDDNTQAYAYNTNNHSANCSEPGCYGYYSWVAATAGSALNTSELTDAPYSICPKGWKMPATRENKNELEQSDFYKLSAAYGNNTGESYQNTSSFYDEAGPGTIPNFLTSSRYSNGRFSKSNENINGWVWSSTAYNKNTSYSYALVFVYWALNTSASYYRSSGYPVRCLVRQ